MEDNNPNVQYRILQEAHETAAQLSASESPQPVTLVQVSNDTNLSEDSSSLPATTSHGHQTVIITSSEGVAFSRAVSDASGQSVMVIAPSVSNTQIVSSSGHVVTVCSPDLQLSSPSPEAGNSQLVITQEEIGEGHPVVNQVQVEVDAIPEGMLCLVCSDRGTGYHYSVFSCEGCKGFFKRSVQKNLQYTCKDGGNCLLNKFTRNSCQYCRFKKCLEVGMKREAVREDRTPGGKHRHKRPRTSANSDADSPIMLPNETCDEALLGKIVESRPDLIPSADGQSNLDNISINQLMQFGYMELRLIIEWARKVPGFGDLLIEDQMALLKSSFMELNVLRLAYRSMNLDSEVQFAHGIILSAQKSSELGWGKDLVNCTLEFVNRLKDVNIDTTEFCILNSVVLTYPDAPGLIDKTSVLTLQSLLLDTLRKYSINRYPNQPRRYGKMLLRLPALRSVSAIAAERFLTMSIDGNIKMNALVLEMMS